MPTETETKSAASIERGETGMLNDVRNVTARGMAIPIRTPKNPPPTLSSSDSVRNCPRISLRDAPTAFLSPISRVRSVTVTSMIFMIPIPEITRASAETLIRTIVRITEIALAVSRIAFRF